MILLWHHRNLFSNLSQFFFKSAWFSSVEEHTVTMLYQNPKTSQCAGYNNISMCGCMFSLLLHMTSDSNKTTSVFFDVGGLIQIFEVTPYLVSWLLFNRIISKSGQVTPASSEEIPPPWGIEAPLASVCPHLSLFPKDVRRAVEEHRTEYPNPSY